MFYDLLLECSTMFRHVPWTSMTFSCIPLGFPTLYLWGFPFFCLLTLVTMGLGNI